MALFSSTLVDMTDTYFSALTFNYENEELFFSTKKHISFIVSFSVVLFNMLFQLFRNLNGKLKSTLS